MAFKFSDDFELRRRRRALPEGQRRLKQLNDFAQVMEDLRVFTEVCNNRFTILQLEYKAYINGGEKTLEPRELDTLRQARDYVSKFGKTSVEDFVSSMFEVNNG